MFIYTTSLKFFVQWHINLRGLFNAKTIPVEQKTLKMILDTSLINTQQYRVRIKGKVEQSRERSSALPYTSV